MRSRILLVVTVATLALAGCADAVSFGRATVAGPELENQVAPLVARELGAPPDSVTCDPIDGEQGATGSCTAEVGDEVLELTVIATGIDGLDVRFELEGIGSAPITGRARAVPGSSRPTSVVGPTTTTPPEKPGGSGPSSSGTAPVVATQELETQLEAGLRAEVGQTPPPVTCARPLDGVVGATARCTLDDGRDRYEITVTVTAVQGADVDFDFVVADRPL